MRKKKIVKLGLAICLMTVFILGGFQAVVAEEEGISMQSVAPGQADMRIGICNESGFLMEAGHYAGNYAPVFYAARWSGSALGDVLPLGHYVYCIEPSVTLLGDGTYSEGGSLGKRDDLLNLTTSRIKQKGKVFEMLGQILQLCGPDITEGSEICMNAAQASKYLAAQTVIWQLVCGDLDENFQVLSSTWADVYDLRSMPYWETAPAGGRSVKAWQEEWLGALQNEQKLPSFCGNNCEMQSGTLTLTDTNGVLPQMSLTASDASVNMTVEGNSLIIQNPKQVDFSVTVSRNQTVKEPVPIVTTNQNTGVKRQTTIVQSQTPMTISRNGFFKVRGLVTNLQISKKQLSESDELPGATLQILDEEGNVLEEWVSSEEPHYIERLPIGRYILRELLPADGYVTAEDIYFEVKDTAEIQKVEMKDDVTKLQISKKDITTGKELAGASLQILNEAGDVVAEWISSEEPYYIEKLPIGAYTLHETIPAKGYVTARDVIFKIEDTAEIQKVEMQDDVTKLEISKKELISGEQLPGASLQVLDPTGSVITEWVSGDQPYYVEKIPAGQYVLHEKAAPAGYQKADDIRFEVADTAQVQKIEMINQQSKTPQTGDGALWQLYAAIIVLAGAMLCALITAKKYKARKWDRK